MTDIPRMSKAELLAKINDGWNAFSTYLSTLTPEQLIVPKDAAGWSAQDHVIHIADWERSLIPFLDKGDRLAVLGVDAATWAEADWDKINGIMQQRSKDLTVEEAHKYVDDAHEQLVNKIKTLADEDLYRPYNYYQPQSKYETPMIGLLQDDTYHHYEEHTPWIAAIVASQKPMSKAELLEKIDKGWNDFNAFLMSLTPPQVTVPTDAAGWRALDHVIHLADWENGVLAMLNKEDRAAGMGVDKATWATEDFDKINDILQKRSKDKTLEQARQYVMNIHQRFVDKIQSLTDEDLQRPYKYYQPDSDREAPVIKWVQMNTYEHYAEHTPWIAAIAADDKQFTKEILLDKIRQGWDEVNAFLDSLTTSQKTQLTDAAGWTVKDHVIHMAAWEDGLTALLDKQYRRAYMGIDDATWKSGDDAINAVLQQRFKDLTWAEVEEKRQAVHDKLLKQIDAMSEETLQLPYGKYNPSSPSERPVNGYIGGSTYFHYADHMPWMAAIVADRTPLSKTQLLTKIQTGWDNLNNFLANLTEEQKTMPTDAAGWTVKDHMIHMAVWENGVVALLNRQDRAAQMGVDAETWASDDDDQINAVIQKRHQDESLQSVEQERQAIHAQLIQQIEGMSDADLQRPISEYDPDSTAKNTISGPIIGNTYMHYADHIPWMAAIAAGK
jgi:hypothetical protein